MDELTQSFYDACKTNNISLVKKTIEKVDVSKFRGGLSLAVYNNNAKIVSMIMDEMYDELDMKMIESEMIKSCKKGAYESFFELVIEDHTEKAIKNAIYWVNMNDHYNKEEFLDMLEFKLEVLEKRKKRRKLC